MKYETGDKFLATLYSERVEVKVNSIAYTDGYWVQTPFGEELWESKDFIETNAELIK